MASSGPAGSRGCVSSAGTTGIASGPKSWFTTRTSFRASGKALIEADRTVATSFALLFLAKGRAPVLVNKLRHGPRSDWNNDPDDVRNLVAVVSRDWRNLLTWQVIDPAVAAVADLLQAPIVFLNGHKIPELNALAKQNLRDYVEQGGFLLADACCSSPEFDSGLKQLMQELFPDQGFELRPLSDDHPVWRAKHLLTPGAYPLWGIEHGCRTVVIYSPKDLSCYWNQAERSPTNTAVILATRVGQNIVDYATGRELPADKLVVREVHDFKADSAKRNALRIAKLQHAGEWNVAPLAVPNLMEALRKPPLSFDVVINHKELSPRDPSLIYYPLIYLHGRAAFSFTKEDLDALRRHLEPGGGTLFGDSACGSPAFDAAFRRFVTELLPNNPLVPIPRDEESTPPRSASTSPILSTPRPPAAARTFPSSRASRSTATGRSSIPSTTSAVPWNDTPDSTARATPTSRHSRSPPISSSIPHCRDDS